ncbi:MAG: hypothetical protein Q9220_001075 [cf. Caloplaca sp. 1 TL-2023]
MAAVLPPGYILSNAIPSVETYMSLRANTGLSAFSAEASERGLPNSLFCVQVMHEGKAVGLGRITGDRGTFFLITDICILPSHRNRGLAKAVMTALMAWIRANVPKTGYVGLSADGRANELYRQFGFRETKEESGSVGMSLTV